MYLQFVPKIVSHYHYYGFHGKLVVADKPQIRKMNCGYLVLGFVDGEYIQIWEH